MENRHGVFVDTRLTRVSGHAERLAGLDMIEPRADRPHAITLGGDKNFDTKDFVMELREINVTRKSRGTRAAVLPLTGARHATPAR